MKRKHLINWHKTSSSNDETIHKKPEKKDSMNTSSLTVQCRKCQQIFTVEGIFDQSMKLDCPMCNHRIRIKKQRSKKTESLEKSKIKTFLANHFVELILLFIGLTYLIQPTMGNIKISFTLILISSILMFLMTGDEPDIIKEETYSVDKPFFKKRLHTPKAIKKLHEIQLRIKNIPLSNRISIVLILWTLLLFVITADVEIYFILIFIGILITRELTDLYTTHLYKKRLNAYIIVFLLSYIVLISQKIMEILAS